MASKSKIYIVLEFVTGGELFDKIVRCSSLILLTAILSFHLQQESVSFCCFVEVRLVKVGSKKMKQESIFSSLSMQWTTVIVEVYSTETSR